ncbi:MAG: hypothetical protein B6D41_06805 [Chloroflexi bacterium UTCFX4]|jgi:hypothetical protein|nr:MAG: hypothetical protein B6D41_06805 [Chloroflexi bacterium UTCFX4]
MNVRHILSVWRAIALLALVTPTLAFAQTPERLTQLDIAVWPEFDDPRALVQFDGTLAAQDGYPRELVFLIPVSAQLNATAYQNEQKEFLNTEPATVTAEGANFKRVTFKTPKPNFHLEYYDDAIQGAPDKVLNFVYQALLPADSVQVQIQQPLKSDNFKTLPAAALISEGMHGFKYHLFNYPGLAANQDLKLQIAYTKTDPNPSMQNVTPPVTSNPTAPSGALADNGTALNTQQIFLLVGATVALALGLLALWMWYTRRQPRLAYAGAPSGGKRAERATAFCSQCGNGLRVGDNFCPKCGAKRK